MKSLKMLLACSLLIVSSFAFAEEDSYGHIDTKGLEALINSKASLTLLDARTKEHDEGSRIANAKLLPYDSSSEIIVKELPSKDSLIIVYCASEKCPLSGRLAHALVKNDYKNVIKYPEGLQGWIDADLKLNKVEK